MGGNRQKGIRVSWHTVIQVASVGDGVVGFDTVEHVIRSIFERDGTHLDVLEDLRIAFSKGEATCNVHPAYLQEVFSQLAPLITIGTLEARCIGDEFRDTWVMSIAEGCIQFSEGPWDP
jgi:hypothetical protein